MSEVYGIREDEYETNDQAIAATLEAAVRWVDGQEPHRHAAQEPVLREHVEGRVWYYRGYEFTRFEVVQ